MGYGRNIDRKIDMILKIVRDNLSDLLIESNMFDIDDLHGKAPEYGEIIDMVNNKDKLQYLLNHKGEHYLFDKAYLMENGKTIQKYG